jgi:hypothetical protein
MQSIKSVSRLGIASAFLCGALGAAFVLPAKAQPDANTAGVAKPAKKATKPRVQGTSHLRVLHAIAGGPSVDVYLDGKKSLESVAYKTLSSYLDVPSGSHVLALRAAGSEANAAPLATLKRSLAADGYFVVSAATIEGKPTLLAQNETTGKLSATKASVRFYHLSPDAPAVSVTAPSTSKLAKDGTRNVVKELLPSKSRSASLAPGTVTLSIRADGKVVKEVPVTVEASTRYAAFVVGKADALEVIVKPVGK